MISLETLRIAAHNVTSQGLRSGLSMLGVIIGIASIFALVSIGDGLQKTTTDQFQKLGSNTIFIAQGGTFSGGGGTARSNVSFSDNDIAHIKSFPEVQYVIPFYMAATSVQYGSEEISGVVMSYDPVLSRPLENSGYVEIKEGRAFNEQDTFAALIGDTTAEKAFSKALHVKNVLTIHGYKFRIVGIQKPSSQSFGGGPNTNNTIFIPEKARKIIFPGSNPVFMFAQTYNKDQVTTAAAKIQRYFDRQYGKDSASVESSQQLLDQVNQLLGVVSLFLVVIASISLVVGGIGIMNAMVMTVMERTKEIGTMKAVGATTGRIMGIFLMEAGLIGLVGGLIGSLLGYGLGILVSTIAQSSGFNLQAVATPQLFIFVLGFSMMVGMISGAYPAWRAAHMDPVVALRINDYTKPLEENLWPYHKKFGKVPHSFETSP